MKNIPLVAVIIFLAVGGFLIWQSQGWTTYVLPEIYGISIPVPPHWKVNCCGDSDMKTVHFVFDPKMTSRDALGNVIYGDSIKITQWAPIPATNPTVEFSSGVSQELRSEFTKRLESQKY